MNITFEFATKDDCLNKMVPSDLRKLVSERDTALAQNAELVAQNEILRREFQDAQRTLQIIASCGADSTDAEIVDVVLNESRRWISRYDDSVLKLSSTQHLRDIQAEAVLDAVKSCVVVNCIGTNCISVRGLKQYAASVKAGEK